MPSLMRWPKVRRWRQTGASDCAMAAPLFLLPGMMCDARLFVSQTEAFSVHREVQVPVSGRHSTMAEMAREILRDAPPRFALAGLSMGGILAMEIMRQAGSRVTHLALMDTNHLGDAVSIKPRRIQQMAAVTDGGLASIMREEMKPNYLAPGADPAILDLCMDMALGLGDDVFHNQSLALISRPDYSETLKEIHCPTLLLCGRHDSLCPVSRHQAMAGLIGHAKLVIAEEAGHLPSLEAPEIVNQALEELLEI